MFGGSSSKDEADAVMVLETKTPATQFDIIPVHLAVLIDQSRIPDLIVGFQNSPMAIQVLDFEMNVPANPVKKPLKGEQRPMGMGNMLGMMGGPSMSMMRTMQNMMSTPMMQMQGPQGGMPSMMPGMPGMPGQAVAKRKGTDVSKKNLEALQKRKSAQSKTKDGEEDDSEASAPKKVTNPYFNIIEVRVYGQARFYKAPPPLPETPNSASPGAEAPADGNAAPAEANTADAAPKSAEPAKADAAPAADDENDDATPDADEETDNEEMDEPAAKDAPPPTNDSDDDDSDGDGDTPKADATKDAPKADAAAPPADAAQPKRR
jgi:hypothetical protein